MKANLFPLQNRGMSRDISISKADNSLAWDNHNVRITAMEHGTLLSVTNERGTKEISLPDNAQILGTVIGWNVLNKHLILFTADGNTSYIYRIDYKPGAGEHEFRMVCGDTDDEENGEKDDSPVGHRPVYGQPLHSGSLGFDTEHPIESIVYYETVNIQKIYWIDGKHVLRFMNFMADADERRHWNDTYFDSNRVAIQGLNVSVSYDYTGITRKNGVVQYIITYYNKHGQETGYVWASSLTYLSPNNRGGAPDGTNNVSVTLRITGFDTTYTKFRVYSIGRTTLDGPVSAYLIHEGNIPSDDNPEAVVVDNGVPLSVVDPYELLYLGGREVIAGTMTHKDQTLFLGDLQSIGTSGYEAIEKAVHDTMFQGGTFEWGVNHLSSAITFVYSNTINNGAVPLGSPTLMLDANDTAYVYESQLSKQSNEITTFKGGELYRFALVFRTANGVDSDAFWIGDAENPLYPQMVKSNGTLVTNRPCVQCRIPKDVIIAAKAAGFVSVRLMIAKATYADRKIVAQGIVNPTMFNVFERQQNRLYSMASWMTRPRGAGFANKHFEPVHISTDVTGEIQCNYWTADSVPTPYYTTDGSGNITDPIDGIPDFDAWVLLFRIRKYGRGSGMGNGYDSHYLLFTAKGAGYAQITMAQLLAAYNELLYGNTPGIRTKDFTVDLGGESSTVTVNIYHIVRNNKSSRPTTWNWLYNSLTEECGFPAKYIISYNDFARLAYEGVQPSSHLWFNMQDTSTYGTSVSALLADDGEHEGAQVSWFTEQMATPESGTTDYTAAFYKKHLMFVDESIVTLNSPEIDYEAVSFDESDMGLRIVGVSKIAGCDADYDVEASPAKFPGTNVVQRTFNDIDGLESFPLYLDCPPIKRTDEDNEPLNSETDPFKLTAADFKYGTGAKQYWLHMWHKSGSIPGMYDDKSDTTYSTLLTKTFANSRYSNMTLYSSSPVVFNSPKTVRQYTATESQYMNITVGNAKKYYNANVELGLSTPGVFQYPVLFSQPGSTSGGSAAFEYTSFDPVTIQFKSRAHAVVSLGNSILPWVTTDDKYIGSNLENAHIPWDSNASVNYNQSQLSGVSIESGDQYVFIGELYRKFSNGDTRYNGYSRADVQSNVFIPAGSPVNLPSTPAEVTVYGTDGDTYFQRWDCLKTIPYEAGSDNSVFDVTSVLLESHINLDGRYDMLRGTTKLSLIDPEKFGQLNPVYSQPNDFFSAADLDEDANVDSYRSSITWTLSKEDSAQVDAWSHITLANSLKLDGDKGFCRALRRFQNSILAFQDRGVAEVLFNSRTQLSTQDGVPVELANSGKVDGKRYISNKFGCSNKWSIVEGKNGLYFVDNANKMIGVFTGGAIDSLSSKARLDAWVRKEHDVNPWTPANWNNFVGYYDRIHSDVYFLKDTDDDSQTCLVYNEQIGSFTGFFDYARVPMMVNLGDRFISVYPSTLNMNKLWLQNEGPYCTFYGTTYPFWVTWRVQPEPYGDKIWTNLEYRSDFFSVLNENNDLIVPEGELIEQANYKPDITFDDITVWNEYQTTGAFTGKWSNPIQEVGNEYPDIRKKFRIWRVDIPRAQASATNKYGLDRIRNPWVYVKLKKDMAGCTDCLMQLHDVMAKYFSEI